MIYTWNVKGASKKGFSKVLFDLRNFFHYEVMAILEPSISGTKASKIVDKLGFSNRFIVEAYGFSSSIWLLWT